MKIVIGTLPLWYVCSYDYVRGALASGGAAGVTFWPFEWLYAFILLVGCAQHVILFSYRGYAGYAEEVAETDKEVVGTHKFSALTIGSVMAALSCKMVEI